MKNEKTNILKSLEEYIRDHATCRRSGDSYTLSEIKKRKDEQLTQLLEDIFHCGITYTSGVLFYGGFLTLMTGALNYANDYCLTNLPLVSYGVKSTALGFLGSLAESRTSRSVGDVKSSLSEYSYYRKIYKNIRNIIGENEDITLKEVISKYQAENRTK